MFITKTYTYVVQSCFYRADYGYKTNYLPICRQQADLSDVFVETSLDNRRCPPIDPEYQHIQLSDLVIVATLGIGGFGRVELVMFPLCHNSCLLLN